MLEKITLRLFIVIVFLGCLATSSFGQSAWIYSDTWMDDNAGYEAEGENIELDEGENIEVNIVGAGVAEINSNSQLHEANIRVELRSPQGRTEYGDGTWYQASSGTSITVVVSLNFPWEPADVGNYLTITGFEEVCPYQPGTLYSGASFQIGLSYAAFQIDLRADGTENCTSSGCWYRRVSPCPVACPNHERYFLVARPPRRAGNCIYTITPYGPLGCSPIHAIRGNVTACVCYDVGWN